MTIPNQAVPSKRQLPSLKAIHIRPLTQELEALLAKSHTELTTLLAKYIFPKESESLNWDFMQQLETIEDRLAKFWAPIQHINTVCETESLRTTYQTCLSLITHWHTQLSQNEKLYQIINAFAQHPHFNQLNTAQKTIITHKLRDFNLAGVHLSASKKNRYRDLQAKLAQLSSQFEANILDASQQQFLVIEVADQLKGLSEQIISAAAAAAKKEDKSGWLLRLDSPNYQAILTSAEDRSLRASFYRAWVTRASDQAIPLMKENTQTYRLIDNTPLMLDILKNRHETSQLLGFNNYAELSLATNKMANSTQAVIDFLNQLLEYTKSSVIKELKSLQDFAKQLGHNEPLCDWDIPYFSEKLRHKVLGIQEEQLRLYFPLPRVLNGLFELLHKLFKIHITQVDCETWHSTVQVFEIHDEKNHIRGYFYLDLYTRAHKREGAWVDDCERRRLRENGLLQLPITFVNCNFATPSHDEPALLNHNDIVTLFHEMGHALHHVLTQVDYAEVAGTQGVPWDAVEFPSQFLENFAWEPEVLASMSSHYQTHEALSSENLQALKTSRTFQAGLQLIRQLEFSLFDFQLHLEFNPAKGPEQIQSVLDKIRSETRLFPAPAFNRFQNSFSHIFGDDYAAGYYSYLWAEVLAADAFSRFEEEGILNAQTGHSFMHNILEPGGSIDILELFQRFRGRSPELKSLLLQRGIHIT